MSDQYTIQLLRIAVAQISQTIGYNATQASSLELLQDILHRFLIEFSRDLRRQVEHYNRTTPNFEDVNLTLSSLNINISELMDYISNVEPIQFSMDVPKFPVQKFSNMNFLKPGSKEVLTRPVHIFEHLPPMLPPDTPRHFSTSLTDATNSQMISNMPIEENANVVSTEFHGDKQMQSTSLKTINQNPENENKVNAEAQENFPALITAKNLPLLDEHGRPTREISSVVMTTGGFISPAIEGKLPEAGIPTIIDKLFGLDAVPPPTPPPQPVSVPLIEEFKQEDLNTKTNLSDDALFSGPKKKGNTLDSKDKVENIFKSEKIDQKNLIKKISVNVKKNTMSSSNSNQQPKMALKLLKKAKKNSAIGMSNTEPALITMEDILSTNLEALSEKSRRKRLKNLQKLLKHSQKPSDVLLSKQDPKKLNLHSLSTSLTDLPSGPERIRFEKLLKKQAKQKQRQIKKQLALEGNQAALQDGKFDRGVLDISKSMESPKLACGAQKAEPKIETIISDSLDTNIISQQRVDGTNSTLLDPLEVTKTSAMENQNSFTLLEKQSGFDIKLSNEPDKSKLNIFKKISKGQKTAQISSPPKSLITPNFFTGNEGQIINLPSGTTITPAPLVFNSAINMQTNSDYTDDAFKCQQSTGSLTGVINPVEDSSNKPKKRGRKPGSKNQPKVPIGPLNKEQIQTVFSIKKPKKIKGSKVFIEPNSHSLASSIPLLPTGAALNLAQFDKSAISNTYPFPLTLPSLTTNTSFAKTVRKDRKEKDKSKFLENINCVPDAHINKDVNMDASIPAGFGNVKLKPVSLLMNSPPERSTPVPSKSKKRPSIQNKIAQLSPPLISAPYLPPVPSSSNFQLSSNMLPMLPFPFSPRPGLIPTPGLFPNATGLANFPNSLPNPTSVTSTTPGLIGLPSPFFPFPNMKTSALQSNSITDVLQKDIPLIPPLIHSGEQNYCNVAPLVPSENLKIVSDSTTQSKSLVTIPSISQHNVTISKEVSTNNLHISGRENNHPDKPPSTSGMVLENNLKFPSSNKLVRKPTTLPTGPSGSTGSFGDFNSKEKYKPTGGIDDPIEVSDDSDDTIKPLVAVHNNPFNTKLANSTILKPSQIQTPLSHTLSSTSSPYLDSVEEADFSRLSKEAKKLKKMPKNSKKLIKTVSPGSSVGLEIMAIKCRNIDSDIGNDSFSKLAGGADLIPITGTGSAYSAKSIPSTSLTAVRVPGINIPHSDSNKKGIGANDPPNIFSDVTITPAAAILTIPKKKNKDHKKLRKLKEGMDSGKIKKKKDKKDKMKERGRMELVLDQEKNFEKQKDILKKLKKEKKRGKQRSIMDSNVTTQIYSENKSTTKAGFSLDVGNNSQISPSIGPGLNTSVSGTVSASMLSIAPVPSVVPKLTLKIGNSQSPTPTSAKVTEELLTNTSPEREPSPELARFSPLVTRPPKKSIQNDHSTASAINRNLVETSGDFNKTILSKSTESSGSNSISQPLVPPPSPWLQGGTLTASSVLLPQQLMTSISNVKPEEHAVHASSLKTASTSSNISSNPSSNTQISLISETSRPSSYVDAEGNTVWICPACGKVDDGSPMIGCDGCDAWYHWECVGITVAPNDKEDWFCRVCITRKKGFHGSNDGPEKKRKRNKKK